MTASGIHDGHPTADNPHTYVKFVARISFLFGFWALFVFFKIEHTYKLLEGSKYIGKFTLMKFFFVLFLLQETIVELITTRGVVGCIPYMSGKSQAFIVLASVVTAQSLVFGIIQFVYYYRYPNTMVQDKVEPLQQFTSAKV